MRQSSRLPDGLDKHAFSTSDARNSGVSRQRTRSAGLHSPYFGVRTHSHPSNTLERAAAYSTRMSLGQFFSHVTAAELLGLRMPAGIRGDALHVSSPAPARATRSRAVLGHQGNLLFETATAHGLPVSSPLDTWLALGTSLSITDLCIMADGLVGRLHPLADLDGLARAVTAHSRRRGHSRLAAALELARADTDSARETMLRLAVTGAGLPEPEVNGEVVDSSGASIARGALLYRENRVILECDDGDHRTDHPNQTGDIDRLTQLMDDGWRVIRVDRNLLSHRTTLIARVTVALEKGGWRRASTATSGAVPAPR